LDIGKIRRYSRSRFYYSKKILYNKNILDLTPTRFGVIQSKFSQDEYTKHLIKKDYVLDSEGNPRNEFFVIINTGNEIEQRIYLLSTEDILNDFIINETKKNS
jgi:hypothetical protein